MLDLHSISRPPVADPLKHQEEGPLSILREGSQHLTYIIVSHKFTHVLMHACPDVCMSVILLTYIFRSIYIYVYIYRYIYRYIHTDIDIDR